MAAPTFVAAGAPVYGSATRWPSSLTVTSSDAPVGVAAGDRLVLFVSVYYSQRTFPTPVDDTLGGFDGVSSWTAITPAQFSASGGTSNGFWQLWASTVRYSASLFPFTLTPLGTASGVAYTPIRTGGVYRAQLCAWRPSGAYGSRGTGTAFNNADFLPNNAYSTSLTDADGILVAAAALPDAAFDSTIGSLTTANGFTERFHQTPITDRGGSLKIADRTPGATGSYSGPVWAKPGQFPENPSGIAMVIAFNAPDPVVAGPGEWGVDQVRW